MENVLDFYVFRESVEMLELYQAIREEQEAEARGDIKYVLNELRFAQVKKSYEAIRSFILSENKSAKVELKPGALSKTYMAIWIETDELNVLDIKKFFDVLEPANTFGVYPLLNETIRIIIGYDNVATMYRRRKK